MQIDIFCQVVDNYGDIGVSWRLAQQLAQQHHVRLFVNHLSAFASIESRIQTELSQQKIDKIEIGSWKYANTCRPAAIVIEAFGCDIPLKYQAQMPDQTELWLNVEYLSAEDWVEDLHLMQSPQPNGIRKHFYFPGFTPKTGGILRPNDWQAVHTRDLSANNILFWQRLQLEQPTTQCTAFVFPYPNAPLELLYTALAQDEKSWTVLLAATAPEPTFEISPSLHIQRLPFIQQADFDALMDYADLNIIRGEDSFVRAIWATKPFIWQPYLQEDNTHLTKLRAWLERTPLDASTQQLIENWSTDTVTLAALKSALTQLSQWQQTCQDYALSLAQQSDLTTQLLAFCSQMHQKAVK